MVAAALGVALLTSGCVLPGMGSPASEVAVQDPAGNLIRLAHAAQQEGRLETALGLYQQAHAVEPHAMVPLLASGEILQSLGRYDEAAALYRQARSQDPTNPDPYRELGKIFIAQDNASEALKEFDAALHRDSRDFRSWNGRGVALDMLGRRKAAQEAYRQGIALAPDNVALRNNLGLSLALDGDHGAAIEVLEALREATPRTRQNLALAYGLAGRHADAEAVARIDLSSDQVRNNLEYYSRMRGGEQTASFDAAQ